MSIRYIVGLFLVLLPFIGIIAAFMVSMAQDVGWRVVIVVNGGVVLVFISIALGIWLMTS